jgi:hypothetical protein
MSDGLPTDEQLRRIEQGVMTRIRRRAQLPKRIATGVALAAVFAGGAFLLPRFGLSGSGAGNAYRSSEQRSAAAGSGALLAECHAASSATSAARSVRLSRRTPSAAISACVLAFEKGQVPAAASGSSGGSSGGSSTSDLKAPITAKDLLACRDADGRLQVFVKDAHPSTLCERNGMATA